ncbi:MAG: 50S ribosomal protein L17 [Crocinitomicaceae bacterium]|nr:50S ribosomal protein L17 [Crocinitomicaceae bacterium]
MRHNKNFNHLGRKTAHRKAMLSNMACSLIEHKRISTTVAKAKALRQFVEPLVTRSKEDTTHSRRIVFSALGNKFAVSELFRSVGPKVASRDGGYTRIIRTGNRLGDNAEMCMIELVDFNDIYGTEAKKKRSRRSRRGGAKAAAAPAAEVAATEAVVDEAPAAEASAEEAPAAEAATEEAPAAEASAEEAPAAEASAEEAPAAEEAADGSEEQKKG